MPLCNILKLLWSTIIKKLSLNYYFKNMSVYIEKIKTMHNIIKKYKLLFLVLIVNLQLNE